MTREEVKEMLDAFRKDLEKQGFIDPPQSFLDRHPEIKILIGAGVTLGMLYLVRFLFI